MKIKDLIEFAKLNGLDEDTELMISYEGICSTDVVFEKTDHVDGETYLDIVEKTD